MKKRGLLCFDLDNTLIFSDTTHVKAYRQALLEQDLPPIPSRALVRHFGLIGNVILKRFFPTLSAQQIQRIVDRQRELVVTTTYRYARPLPHIVRTLSALKKHYTLALVTNCKRVVLLKLLRTTRIPRTLFTAIIGNDDVKHPKPAPDEIVKAEKLLHLHADYMIGDTIYDAIAAQKAHVKCIAVLSGHFTKRQFKNYHPYKLIKNANQLTKILC